MIDRVRDPSGAVLCQFTSCRKSKRDLQETDSNVRRRVDEANKPGVLATFGRAIAIERIVRDTHLNRKGEIGAIRTSLIPTLDAGSDGVEDDSEVENARVLPLVSNLLGQNSAVFFIELVDGVNMGGVLSNQRSLDQVWCDISEVELGGEIFDIADQLVLRDAHEGVLDPRSC